MGLLLRTLLPEICHSHLERDTCSLRVSSHKPTYWLYAISVYLKSLCHCLDKFQKDDRLLKRNERNESNEFMVAAVFAPNLPGNNNKKVKFKIVNYYWSVYNIILVDGTVGPLVRIKNIKCSSCTQLQKSNQHGNSKTSKVIHHKRSDRSHQSNYFPLMEQHGKEMWASESFIRKRYTNPRTEPQISQRRQLFEFARNGTSELIMICSNRMARKCELGGHS
jgi:hypothetical protein